jgi:hypothetical protein
MARFVTPSKPARTGSQENVPFAPEQDSGHLGRFSAPASDTFELDVGIRTSDGETRDFSEFGSLGQDAENKASTKFPNHCLLQMFGSITLLHIYESGKPSEFLPFFFSCF